MLATAQARSLCGSVALELLGGWVWSPSMGNGDTLTHCNMHGHPVNGSTPVLGHVAPVAGAQETASLARKVGQVWTTRHCPSLLSQAQSFLLPGAERIQATSRARPQAMSGGYVMLGAN